MGSSTKFLVQVRASRKQITRVRVSTSRVTSCLVFYIAETYKKNQQFLVNALFNDSSVAGFRILTKYIRLIVLRLRVLSITESLFGTHTLAPHSSGICTTTAPTLHQELSS